MNIKNRSLFLKLTLQLALILLIARCTSNDEPEPVDCSTVNIQLDASTMSPTGCAASDGSISVTATGGTAPYQYSINNGTFSTGNLFSGLASGTYTVRVKDRNNCEQTGEVSISAATSSLAFTAIAEVSGCKTQDGSITVTAQGGSASYEYRLDEGTFGTASTFTGLGAGSYLVTVRDSEGCLTTQSVALATGITYQNTIKEILDTNCAISGCHVTGGAAPMSLQTYSVAQSRASDIKNAVLSNAMPKGGPPLSQDLKDKIACWADDNGPEN